MEKFSKNFVSNEKGNSREFSADSITEKRPLGQGRFGEVSEVEVTKDSVTMNFAIKDYKRNGTYSNKEARKNAEAAYSNYLNAKQAGLKVFSTVRLSKDKPQLLLTLGSNNETILISKDSAVSWERVSGIANMGSLVEAMGQNVIKSVQAGIKLRRDSYFFLAQKDRPTNIDFLVGDYERLEKSERTPRELFKKNMVSVRDVLVNTLVEKYLKLDSDEAYEFLSTFITKQVQDFVDNHELEFK